VEASGGSTQSGIRFLGDTKPSAAVLSYIKKNPKFLGRRRPQKIGDIYLQ